MKQRQKNLAPWGGRRPGEGMTQYHVQCNDIMRIGIARCDGIRIGDNPDYFNAAGTFPVNLGSFRPEGTE